MRNLGSTIFLTSQLSAAGEVQRHRHRLPRKSPAGAVVGDQVGHRKSASRRIKRAKNPAHGIIIISSSKSKSWISDRYSARHVTGLSGHAMTRSPANVMTTMETSRLLSLKTRLGWRRHQRRGGVRPGSGRS